MSRHRPERVDKQGTWFTPETDNSNYSSFDEVAPQLAERPKDARVTLVKLPPPGEPLLVRLPPDPAAPDRVSALSTTQRRLLAAAVGAVAVIVCGLVVWAIVPSASTTPPTFASSQGPTGASLPPVGNVNTDGTFTLPSASATTSSAIEANQTTAAPTTSASVKKSTTTAARSTTAPAVVAPTTSASATLTSPSPVPDDSTTVTTSESSSSPVAGSSSASTSTSASVPDPDPDADPPAGP